jgi:hypothetical protein
MKSSSKFILTGTLLAAGLQLAVLTGCVGGGGGYADDGGYYGGDPVFYGGVYVNGGGGGWYRGHDDHAYAHPAYHPSPAAHAAPAHSAPAPSGGDHRR